MFSEPEALDISKLRERMNTPQTTEKSVQKPLNDCRKFTFKPKDEKDIDRILRYFRERDNDVTVTIPKDILIEAK
jgi:hypothetical protein